MSKASFYCTVANINGKHDSKAIKRELGSLPGVNSVSVNEIENRIAVDYDSTGVQRDRIQKQLEKLGYEAVDSKVDDHVM